MYFLKFDKLTNKRRLKHFNSLTAIPNVAYSSNNARVVLKSLQI